MSMIRDFADRLAAINQRKGVLEKMSEEGLTKMLVELEVTGVHGVPATKGQLVRRILDKLYGKADVEAYLRE